MSSTTRISRARLANMTGRLGADHPEVLQARREHHVLMLEEEAERVAATFGPIPDDVAERVASILRGVA